MFTKKSIKIILAWICLFVMLMPYVSTVATAAETVIVNTPYGNVKLETKTANLQSIFPRNGEYGYKIGGYGILKIWNNLFNSYPSAKIQASPESFYMRKPIRFQHPFVKFIS